MVNSISNDNSSTRTAARSSGSEQLSTSQQRSQAETAERPESDDTLELSSGSRLFSESTQGTRASGAVESPEQAAELASRVRREIETSAAQALQAQASGRTDAGILLESGPA